jgi:hypothetical protein
MIPVEVWEDLACAGLSKVQAAAVRRALQATEKATEEACSAPLLRRRRLDATRQKKRRNKLRDAAIASRDITLHERETPPSCDDRDSHATAADLGAVSPPKKEKSPRTPLKEKNSPSLDDDSDDSDSSSSVVVQFSKSRVDNETDDDDSLIAKLRQATGPAVGIESCRSALPAVRGWIDDGSDLEQDILPAIADTARKLENPRTVFRAKYLAADIMARRDARLAHRGRDAPGDVHDPSVGRRAPAPARSGDSELDVMERACSGG